MLNMRDDFQRSSRHHWDDPSGNDIVSEWLALLRFLRRRPINSEAEVEHGIVAVENPELPGREVKVVVSRAAFARAYERLDDVASIVEGYGRDRSGTLQRLVFADLIDHLRSTEGLAVEMHFTDTGTWSIIPASRDVHNL